MLTQRQELFTLNLFQGLTQREAWIKAGYSDKYALSNVDRNACILANQTKIKQRLAELRGQVQAKLVNADIADKTERLGHLTKIVRHEVETPVTAGHVIAASHEIALIKHDYEDKSGAQPINVIFVVGRGYQEQKVIEGKDAVKQE